MIKLTDMEKACVLVMGSAGVGEMDDRTAEEIIDDNMCMADLSDFPFDASVVRGVISSLIKKGLAVYFPRDDETDLYWLTDNGVRAFFEMKNA